jgi:hypothetical protein
MDVDIKDEFCDSEKLDFDCLNPAKLDKQGSHSSGRVNVNSSTNCMTIL